MKTRMLWIVFVMWLAGMPLALVMLASTTLAAPRLSAAAQAVSAEGEGLVIAIDHKTKTISGYYSASTGYDEKSGEATFSCMFYLRGQAIGKSPYRITTWFPDAPVSSPVIDGKIDFSAGEVNPTVTITLKSEHGGCWNVQHFADAGGASFSMDKLGTWSAVRVVSSQRAYFHDKAQSNTRRKAYVTRGDGIKVLSQANGWAYVEYSTDSGGKTIGWIKASDLFSADLSTR